MMPRSRRAVVLLGFFLVVLPNILLVVRVDGFVVPSSMLRFPGSVQQKQQPLQQAFTPPPCQPKTLPTFSDSRFHLHQSASWDSSGSSHNDDDEGDQHSTEQRHQGGRHRRSWRQRWRRWSVSFALATSVLRGTGAPPPAHAKFSYELRETPTSSLRPGTTREQADLVEQGALDGRSIQAQTTIATESPASTSTATMTKMKKQPTKKQSSLYQDGEDDEYDDDDDLDDFLAQDVTADSGFASQADQTAAQRLQSRSNFAAYHEGKSRALTFKVGAAFFVPTYGALIVREYVRRRREEAYVQKGLEILEAQKAEYFNVTETAADSDVEDALKNLKKNETDTDDEDDDDDADEDEDDEEDDDTPRGRTRRGGPRRPPGGGDGNDGGSSGGGPSDGSGRPSDEDLDKLNQMFKRS